MTWLIGNNLLGAVKVAIHYKPAWLVEILFTGVEK